MNLEDMTLVDVEKRISELDTEVREMKTAEEIEKATEEKRSLLERQKELKELETRKQAALDLQNGAAEGKVIEERGKEIMENANEKRAKAFVESGKMETRAVLSTGKIAAPTKADGVNGLAAVAADIVDDVNAIPLTGSGAWVVGYKKTDAEAADVTDGSAVGGTGFTYDYVTINPAEWGVIDQVSNQVKKMTPVNYLNAVEESALIALRAKASDKIVAAIKASDLVEKRTGIALDADFLKNLVLGFRAIKTKGAVDMPMWDNYEIKTDEGGKYFENNQIGVRGLQTANADLVAWHGMQHITQA